MLVAIDRWQSISDRQEQALRLPPDTLTLPQQADATASAAGTFMAKQEACGGALRQQHRDYIEQRPSDALERYHAEIGAFGAWLSDNGATIEAARAMPPSQQTELLERYAAEMPFRISLPTLEACRR